MEQANTVLFYKFYLDGIKEPIVIEAMCKDDAVGFLRRHKDYVPAPIVGLHVQRPLFGVTVKKEGNMNFVWCGFENSFNGWMEEENFKALSKNILK
jgi:hypothetical protein